MTKFGFTPTASPCTRRSFAHVAWKVPTQKARAISGPHSLARRARISPAALFVNVTARMRQGATRSHATRFAMRYVMTRVLPLPAPANTRRGPFVWATADACGSLRSSSPIAARIVEMKLLTAACVLVALASACDDEGPHPRTPYPLTDPQPQPHAQAAADFRVIERIASATCDREESC